MLADSQVALTVLRRRYIWLTWDCLLSFKGLTKVTLMLVLDHWKCKGNKTADGLAKTGAQSAIASALLEEATLNLISKSCRPIKKPLIYPTFQN